MIFGGSSRAGRFRTPTTKAERRHLGELQRWLSHDVLGEQATCASLQHASGRLRWVVEFPADPRLSDIDAAALWERANACDSANGRQWAVVLMVRGDVMTTISTWIPGRLEDHCGAFPDNSEAVTQLGEAIRTGASMAEQAQIGDAWGAKVDEYYACLRKLHDSVRLRAGLSLSPTR